VRAVRAVAERRVYLENADDGMAWLHHLLPAAEAHAAFDRLTRLARREMRRPCADTDGRGSAGAGAGAGAGADGGPTHRTLAQSRSDIASRLLLGGSVSGPPGSRGAVSAVAEVDGIRPRVHVTVPVLTLLGLSESPAVLDGYGPIDGDTARRLAAWAPSFTRILTHPETGVVLSVGRTSYAVPADLRRFVELRDRTCRFPGCGTRARRCEIDHTVAWAGGGETAHDNLTALCARHHHLKHESTWSVRSPRSGPAAPGRSILEWTSPTGRTHTTEPEPP